MIGEMVIRYYYTTSNRIDGFGYDVVLILCLFGIV